MSDPLLPSRRGLFTLLVAGLGTLLACLLGGRTPTPPALDNTVRVRFVGYATDSDLQRLRQQLTFSEVSVYEYDRQGRLGRKLARHL